MLPPWLKRQEYDCHSGTPFLGCQLSGMSGLLAHQWYRTRYLSLCHAQIHIADFKVETPLDPYYKDGILQLKVKLTNESDIKSPYVVSYRLLDDQDQQVTQSSTRVEGDQNEVEFTKKTLRGVKHWTAETPNLYTLVISLKRTNGEVIEATSCKVGFRTIEIKDKQLLVNGVPILIKV